MNVIVYREPDDDVQVKLTDLPAECGGAVGLRRGGVQWVLIDPASADTLRDGIIDLTGVDVDIEAWQSWGDQAAKGGHMVSVRDMADRFDLPHDVALRAFWQYAAEALMRDRIVADVS